MRYRRQNFAAFSILAAASLAGCNGTSPANQTARQADSTPQANAQIPTAPAKVLVAQASVLMAAAEPFENLTENSFITDTTKLDGFIAKAKIGANGVSRILPFDAAKTLAGSVTAIDAARAGNNRADLAIAAVEGYRTLVSNAGDHTKVPQQVSLLDYSGFRFQADLKASPMRWSDTASALDFADTQWQQISEKVADQILREKMALALADMRSAIQSKDAKAAMAASTRELDLVDGLEHYFAR
jgi:hypothetical protein